MHKCWQYYKHSSFFVNSKPLSFEIFRLIRAFKTHAFRTMPKARVNTDKIRQMRLKASKEKPQTTPSEIYLCVLGNGSSGSPRSLYMFTDHSRYLFNCGEGTQRLAHEYKMKLSKLEHIFLTHCSWENLGGLLGLSLTVQDIGVPQLTLHGPPNVEEIYAYTRPFVQTKGLQIGKRPYSESPFVDQCMEVEYVPIFSSTSKTCGQIISNSLSSDSDSDSAVPHAQKKMKISSVESAVDVTVAYICKGHNKKGHLMLQKCVKLGVPSGPLLGELKNGKDIILPSGKLVCSHEVVSPDEPCPVFLVVECPHLDFLDNFVTEEKLSACQDPSSSMTASLVVHFTPSYILHSSKYKEWMSRFPKSTCHLILNEDNVTTNSIAVHKVQHMLHLLHPGMFNLLHESNGFSEFPPENQSSQVQAKTLYRYYLRPSKGLDRDCEINIKPESYKEEAMNTEGFADSLETLYIELEKKMKEQNNDEKYPEIVFLGTGSCIPNKVRNVSGILVNISANGCLLMDCGEGTYNQLLHLHGPVETEDILRNIVCILISHLHADHHLGLITLLKKRKSVFDAMDKECPPVIIVAPDCINEWLCQYDRGFESISSFYRFIENSTLHFEKDDEATKVHRCSFLNDLEVSTVPVQHCRDAYGFILNMPSKWKIVYSGDTVPCEQLVAAGKDCTLLIHEATMEDDLQDEAALKMHSTTSQAIDIAEKMNAKYTILTHFSQRYAKIPILNESFHSHVGCAFDNMRVRMCDLPVISLLLPTLQILFAEDVEKLVSKGNKRKEKIQLINNV